MPLREGQVSIEIEESCRSSWESYFFRGVVTCLSVVLIAEKRIEILQGP
jgi:hypothetical protein